VSKLWLLSLGLLSSMYVYADEQGQNHSDIELPSPWDTEVEFGYQAHTGNSDSRSLNSRLNAEYVEGRHRTSGEWKFYLLYKDGEEDKRQSTYSAQSDYKLTPKTYLYSSFRGVDSRYSAYYKDYTLSGGLGYQLSNTDKFLLEIELGPGFRYQEPNLDEIDDDDIIFPETVQEGIFRGNINTRACEACSSSGPYGRTRVRAASRAHTEISASLVSLCERTDWPSRRRSWPRRAP